MLPARLQIANDAEDLPDEQRREPERGLVKQKQARRGHQASRDGEHLLLSAAETARGRVPPFAQDREVLEAVLRARAHACVAGAAPASVGSEQKVVHDGLVAEQPASLGNQGHAARDDAVGGRRRELFSVKPNAALDRPQNARDRLQAGALARTVASDQRHELAVADRQAGAAQRFDRAVSDAQIANFEHDPRLMGEQELVTDGSSISSPPR